MARKKDKATQFRRLFELDIADLQAPDAEPLDVGGRHLPSRDRAARAMRRTTTDHGEASAK